ncbi:HD domain-containing protein [Nocardia sp. CNY236]|uniref:HD domain-containing protein n=1 Tax=Nocardia sp. CNY236 TaxID=1169152 RepID=UPI0003FDF8DA|nr:HD domain-containing protein [Nocardia sp. CNY236]
MAAPTGIDWEWATRTGGSLSKEQRRKLGLTIARTLPGDALNRARLALGRRGRGTLEFTGLRLPDSKLAVAAETEARETLTPHMLEHSFRTYYFGRVLADLDGATYDDELVYVSCLLHDLQLEHPTPGRCFAVTGAERAVAFALDAGADPARADAIGAAIAAHITPGVADDLTDPGGFVSAGARTDVIGARLSEFDRDWVAELLRRHPRHDFKRHALAAMENEAKAVPEGRIHFLVGAGFLTMIRRAQFAE